MATKEKNELEEMSAMGTGAVQGSSGKKKTRKENNFISRQAFLEELELRGVIKESIKVLNRKQGEEKELRLIIRKLIKEAKKDTQDLPHNSTAINLLEDLLKQILPSLEIDYKALTTNVEQRVSFRAHIINAVSTVLETEEINARGGGELVGLDEEVDINVGEDDEEKFIDIAPADGPSEEEKAEEEFGIEGQDETGRKLAKPAFENMEKNIVETYGILSDETDKKLFRDYLITNLKLYFDKWEKELGEVSEPTTDEYETEKSELETGGEIGADLGSELGGEAPAPIGGEEVVQ
jgi:hypothetical protein